MEFRLFGHDVEITGSFWLSALLLGVLLSQDRPIYIVIWILVMLVGVLVHEFGHALAFRMFGIRSQIRLHFMGGVTIPNALLPLSRPALVFISFAGPLAGFLLAAFCAGILAWVHIPHFGMRETLSFMVSVNIFWSIFNLAPVLPLDGGHILEHALGPRRYRITLGISALAGAGLAVWFMTMGSFIATFIFGSAALQSFLRLREVNEAVRDSRMTAGGGDHTAEHAEQVEHGRLSPEVARELDQARRSLDDGDLAATLKITDALLSKNGDPKARSTREKSEALGLTALALLRSERVDEGAQAIAEMARLGVADVALLGTLALLRGDDEKARTILEKALADGDQRKEVFGPLIQVLLRKGEVARAAAVAFDCIEGLSSEDARVIAELCIDSQLGKWGGRLLEAVYERDHQHDDAIDAARAFAAAGDGDSALSLLRRAVGAGFDDADRVYADDALKGLALESILPRPS